MRFDLKGPSYTTTSACSSGAHAIGLATRMIRAGIHDAVIAGASDEIDWTRAAAFDAMHALSRGYNDAPERASRPFDTATPRRPKSKRSRRPSPSRSR